MILASGGHGGEVDPAHHVEDLIYRQDWFNLGGIDFHLSKHLVMIWIVAALVTVLFVMVGQRIKRGGGLPKGPLANALEAIVAFVRNDLVIPNMGHHGEPFVPFFLSVFTFILFANLAGLIPGSATATGNICVTTALSLMVLAVSLVCGMKAQGPVAYWVNLVPHGIVTKATWWLFPVWIMMLGIELLGLAIKHFALLIRLYANMIAGHIVIVSVLALVVGSSGKLSMAGVAVPLTVMMFFLELLVAFLQAYVFTLLSVLFVGMAVHPDH